jgi:hypothetical protein
VNLLEQHGWSTKDFPSPYLFDLVVVLALLLIPVGTKKLIGLMSKDPTPRGIGVPGAIADSHFHGK